MNDDLTDKEIEAAQYRFSGYNLPMIQLDETGPAYVFIAEPHPYYRNQPQYWIKPAYRGSTLGTTSNVPPYNTQTGSAGNTCPNNQDAPTVVTTRSGSVNSSNGNMLPF